MPAKILNGQLIAQDMLSNLAKEIKHRESVGLRKPGLAVILVGNDPASIIYVTNKQQAAQDAGIIAKTYHLSNNTKQQDLLKIISTLNTEPNVDGILVQLPLPAHIDSKEILEHINPKKDVDGLHPVNIGKLAQGNSLFKPCTPHGIMLLLQKTRAILTGLHAVIVGASNIVGKPMALELLTHNATVTICHKYTKDLEAQVKQADLLIVATGNPNLIKGSWIKPKAIIIDVGMNRLTNGSLVGDVEFAEAKKYASWITPVPKGVGPMTIAVLLQNTLLANKLALEGKKI